MINQPEHALVDFVALAAQLTNEQKILACLERIEVLLIKPAAGGPLGVQSMSQFLNKGDFEGAKKATAAAKSTKAFGKK
jgi:hypothetical protein